MNTKNEKCVLILDAALPAGIAANTAAILGISLGMKLPDVVGADVFDGKGMRHLGIIQFPVPVLKGNAQILHEIREKLFQPEFETLTVVDFSELAQGFRTYEEFTAKMTETAPENLKFLGLAICGQKRSVNRLTGNLPLFG